MVKPLGCQKNAAMRFLLQVEQVHLRAQLAVVALGGFFEPEEVRVELLLVEPAGAVDAGQLRVLLVAAPVGAGDAHQLERLPGSSLPVEGRCGPRHMSIQSSPDQ
jgi:hypothetical protein